MDPNYPNANSGVDQAELDNPGSTRVAADVLPWSGYRYSNVRDALAAAKRETKP